ncbi:MAG TPA: S8 family serine peptidase [Actinomycetota bacterium]|nr:S8 family serine peptidase [Actinomycetota bacterium]
MPDSLRRSAAFVVAVALVILGAPLRPLEAKACLHPASAYEGGSATQGRDPFFDEQWGLERIKAPEAWKQGATGKGAVIAILDSGIDLSHPDLRDRLVRGVDLASGSDCPGPHDEGGHGTSVAGVAAATAGNGIGISGVAPEARLMPVRTSSGREAVDGPDDITAINRVFAKGIRWAADHGADVINISYSLWLVTKYPVEDDGIEAALAYAWRKGSVVVAAAGNNMLLPICDYPANDAHVVCVGSTDELGLPTYYSNQPHNSSSRVGLRAPGGRGIPGCTDRTEVWATSLPRDCDGGLSGYVATNGTSLASPHVAGVAALLAGAGLTNQEIVDCLMATALNPLTGQRGQFDPVYGHGEVDAAAAVSTCVR